MKTSDEYLQEGIAAYKKGRKQEAGRLIKHAIQLNPKNEAAWLWLSGVVESDEQRRTCLRRVLALNPDNKLARRGLQKLAAEPPKEKRPSPPIQQPSSILEPTLPVQTLSPTLAVPAEDDQPEPEPDTVLFSERVEPQPTEEKRRSRLRRPLFFGIVLLLIVIFGGAAVFWWLEIPLPSFTTRAFSSSPAVSPEEESAIISAIYENIAANNAENVGRYMATIHTQSRGFDLTRQKIESLYRDYDLVATISGVEVVQYSQNEARVTFVLETRKQNGPDFRDNRINGTFILRPEDGQWKLYDQVVSKIQYFEYVE